MALAKAFGSQSNCLGIIVVRDLPSSYVTARERLLKLAYRFANLEPSTRERYADSRSKYRCVFPDYRRTVLNAGCSFGWSHGKVC